MRYGAGALATLLASPHAGLALLVFLDVADTPVYATTANFDIVYDGHTYGAVGMLGAVEAATEGTDLEARGIKLTLSGVKSENISMAAQSSYQGRVVMVSLVGLDENLAAVGDPVLIWRGFMDTMTMSFKDANALIDVACEHRLVDWARPRIRRYNDADQRAMYPDDCGFEFLAQMQDRPIVWPSKKFFQQ